MPIPPSEAVNVVTHTSCGGILSDKLTMEAKTTTESIQERIK